jgi:hypothetical protein
MRVFAIRAVRQRNCAILNIPAGSETQILGYRGGDYAFAYCDSYSDRGWRSSLAREYLHTNGWVDQIDPERGSGYRRGDLADKYFWSSTLRPALSRWVAELL